MVTVCPARLAIAIYTRVMITSDVVGRAVPYENEMGKYGVGKSVTRTKRPVEVWPFDSRLAVARSLGKRAKEYDEVCVVTDQPDALSRSISKCM
jgi:hypothetical protein